MKKYYRIFLAVCVGIITGIGLFSLIGHAMTTQDLSGKVYKISQTLDGETVNNYVYFNNKGKYITVDDPDQAESKSEKKQLQRKQKKLATSKKYARKLFKKDGEKYSVENNEIIADSSLLPFAPMIDNPIEIAGGDGSHFDLQFLDDSPRAQELSDDGNGVYLDYSMDLADQSLQYKFQW